MELLSKEQQELRAVLIAKHDSDILKATNELYEWIGDDSREILEEILYYWLSTYDGDFDERSSAIFKFRRIIEFAETVAKINSSISKKELLILGINERVN